ncbi:LysR family transcriptional regulator [Enterovibrio norvegicus FF-33]|uniref:LysR family transcriptional regulator n=1 Tax=Enterovibrio norvegicus FF-454 TaxID=1185651 RepID=A0A1E5BX25_9GAMM|nr:LysR family transcriptional regulator [Enterovibrio norvegicus]OEE57482.1 LysR family transcriptional regulator [Enterovibrio norvegicus FF-454]OEE67249.1 LysR family transcriptional regulator [Enterovibrio norvegicus FF-33]OEE85057.1 LysR family transcriptional regulator [Enterovibrio norvegicus FF-162]
MQWTLEQLKAFTEAAEAGSFSAAARKLGKAQSRVSTAIANLEVDLGFDLFDRSAKLPVLTNAGKEMLVDAKAILQQCQRMNSRAMAVTKGEPVAFTVAMDEAVPIQTFETLFEMMADSFPELKLTILNGSQDDIATWVNEGRADIGFIFRVKPLSESLDWYDITTVKQVLIASPQHPLSAIDHPHEDDLVKHRQLAIRDRLGSSQEQPLSPRYWHVDSYYYISGLVNRNLGWAFVPEHIVNHDWMEGSVKTLSTAELSSPPLLTLSAIKKKTRGWDKVMLWIDNTLNTLFPTQV